MALRADVLKRFTKVSWGGIKYIVLHLSIGTFTGFSPPFTSDVVAGPGATLDILYHHDDEFFKVWLITINKKPEHPDLDRLFEVTFEGPSIEAQPDGFSALNVILDCFAYGSENEVDLTKYYFPLKKKSDGSDPVEKAFVGKTSGRDDILPLTADAYGTAYYFLTTNPDTLDVQAQGTLVLRD